MKMFLSALAVCVSIATVSHAEIGPCQEHNLEQKVACLNARLEKAEQANAELKTGLSNLLAGIKNVQIRSTSDQRKCLTDHLNVSVNLDECSVPVTHWQIIPSQ